MNIQSSMRYTPLYTDTDSFLCVYDSFTKSNLDKLKAEGKLIGKDPGKLQNELVYYDEEQKKQLVGKGIRFICLAPKTYCLEYVTRKANGKCQYHYKMASKGMKKGEYKMEDYYSLLTGVPVKEKIQRRVDRVATKKVRIEVNRVEEFGTNREVIVNSLHPLGGDNFSVNYDPFTIREVEKKKLLVKYLWCGRYFKDFGDTFPTGPLVPWHDLTDENGEIITKRPTPYVPLYSVPFGHFLQTDDQDEQIYNEMMENAEDVEVVEVEDKSEKTNEEMLTDDENIEAEFSSEEQSDEDDHVDEE